MKKSKDLDQGCDYFSAIVINSIVWIKLKENMLLQSTNLQCRDELIDYLDRASADESVQIVVIVNSEESTGYEKYAEFYRMLKERKIGQNEVWRMLRTFDSLTKKIFASQKFFISATKGELYPLLLNVSLACDYRVIADNTSIKNVYLDFGLAPKGGAIYFLNRRLGHCKAFELLLSEDGITANEALKIGLVNKVVPLHSLEKITFKMAQEFAKKPSDSVKLIKKLLNSSEQKPADYLEFENHELMHTLGFMTEYGRFGWGR